MSDALRPYKGKYGLSDEQVEQLAASQAHRCAICDRPEDIVTRWGSVKNLAIDHCHTTGMVRGMLCTRCNAAIGYLRDDPHIALSAAAYLLTSTGWKPRHLVELPMTRVMK